MNYYELRSIVAGIVPRMTQLFDQKKFQGAVREKGRKSGYQEFKLVQQDWVKQERLLNTEEINSFAEISCRAAACPMPLNLDVWDSLVCPFKCKYCFANAFRASLYTAFFDNSKTMGMRHCDPDKTKHEMDKFMKLRGKDPHSISGDIQKAFAMEMPVRFGIRFEDFLEEEKTEGISLQLLQYLAEQNYPTMINTKSSLIGTEPYVDALANNGAGAAVHVTLISSDDELLKNLEPGAPCYKDRVAGMEMLVKAGVRVVARIEPFLPFINDKEEDVRQYIKDMKRIGVKNITFDTYSYSANNPGIRQSFLNSGIDWERIFTLGCDSQALGSLLLGKFMEIFREEGFSCSTFDMGNAPDNDQDICCEVGDWFKDSGFNYGCSVMASRYIQQAGHPVRWNEFKDWVNEKGGFLSNMLELEVHQLWNFDGNQAYSHAWSKGIEAVGWDEDGMIWEYNKETKDFRKTLLEGTTNAFE
jgi:DNA repair photolyase